ncbi:MULTISPECIES: hypothetical protein [unclassified Deinococcus]|uniref:hypothetical protein n=1 Tax=unclassified Deinococcus TaxID=2623546 RepID=UPI001C30DEFF|nr:MULTISPECIES: hypothetical protein [unclassified Deinococcus]MDK2014477.1 hypothetical protein [Deinococcus sp. 43]
MNPARWAAACALLTFAFLGSWVLAAPWATQTSMARLTLRPGGQVASAAGVQVTAPPRWRPEAVPLVRVEIQAVSARMLPVPLMSGVTPATAVYRIRAEPAVQTADAGRFLVRLPVKRGGTLVPLRLTAPMLDLAPGVNGASLTKAEWTSDSQATRRGHTIEFQTTSLSFGEVQYFTVVRLED